VDAPAVIRRLRELDERSGGRRVAWTDTWKRERETLWEELAAAGLETERDPAGNLWARLPGASPDEVVVGSHLDCVPDGGWLDGCLGVMAGVEAILAASRAGAPARTLTLVDWADEEGARFGHSLLGSSAAAGLLDVEAAGRLEGLREALAAHDVVLEDMPQASARLGRAKAYVELHIEQGPVLEAEGRPACAVQGCMGVRRTEFLVTGRAGHAGATPMDLRRDPLVAAARAVGELRDEAVRAGGLATVGSLHPEPPTPTAIPARVRWVTDIRHTDLAGLDALQTRAELIAEAAARAEGCTLGSAPVWSIDPLPFDAALVARAAELTGGGRPLTSGPLHDAAAVCRAGIPTVMLFVRSRGGVSHSREEDTADGDLLAGIEAFGALVAELAAA
jgi:N-carbamoyl-L-amino-acid hydrolase